MIIFGHKQENNNINAFLNFVLNLTWRPNKCKSNLLQYTNDQLILEFEWIHRRGFRTGSCYVMFCYIGGKSSILSEKMNCRFDQAWGFEWSI